jgi:hypothetical protein
LKQLALKAPESSSSSSSSCHTKLQAGQKRTGQDRTHKSRLPRSNGSMRWTLACAGLNAPRLHSTGIGGSEPGPGHATLSCVFWVLDSGLCALPCLGLLHRVPRAFFRSWLPEIRQCETAENAERLKPVGGCGCGFWLLMQRDKHSASFSQVATHVGNA